jgi:hypothetical protein
MPRPVLQRLGQVGGRDRVFAGQIGNGARQFKHPVKGTGHQMWLAHRLAHQRPPVVIDRAVAPHLARPHIGIAGQAFRCPSKLRTARRLFDQHLSHQLADIDDPGIGNPMDYIPPAVLGDDDVPIVQYPDLKGNLRLRLAGDSNNITGTLRSIPQRRQSRS